MTSPLIRFTPKAAAPFSILQTQDVSDLSGVHDILIKTAHQNSLIRQKERKFLFIDHYDDSEDSNTVNLPREAVSLSSFIHDAFDPSNTLGMESSQTNPNYDNDGALAVATQLPALNIRRESNSIFVPPNSIDCDISSGPKGQRISETCTWCRKAGRWCGWCRVPSIVRTRKGTVVAAEGYHSHLEQHLEDSKKVFSGTLDPSGKGRSSSSLGRLERVEHSSQAKLNKSPDLRPKGRREDILDISANSSPKSKLPSISAEISVDHEHPTRRPSIIRESPEQIRRRKPNLVVDISEKTDPLHPLRKGRPIIRSKAKAETKEKAKNAAIKSMEIGAQSKYVNLLMRNKLGILTMLTQKEFIQLANMVHPLNFGPGDTVFQHGDIVISNVQFRTYGNITRTVRGPPIYFVAAGVFHVYTAYQEDGTEEQVATLTRGGVLGDFSAIVGGRRCCTVRAATPGVILEIMKSTISSLLCKMQNERLQAEKAEHERLLALSKAELRLSKKTERARFALKAKESKTRELKIELEKRTLGTVLSDLQREREWTSGSHARVLKRELQSMLEEIYIKLIQHAVMCMHARRILAGLKKEAEERLRAVLLIQKIFRGTLIRKRMQREKRHAVPTKRSFKSSPPRSSKWVSEWLTNMNMKRQEAELRMHEQVAHELCYRQIQKQAREDKLRQARSLLSASQEGKISEFVFYEVSQQITVPNKALCRWLSGNPLVQKKKPGEDEMGFARRAEALEGMLHTAILRWFDGCRPALEHVAQWRRDVHGLTQTAAQLETATRQTTRIMLSSALPSPSPPLAPESSEQIYSSLRCDEAPNKRGETSEETASRNNRMENSNETGWSNKLRENSEETGSRKNRMESSEETRWSNKLREDSEQGGSSKELMEWEAAGASFDYFRDFLLSVPGIAKRDSHRRV